MTDILVVEDEPTLARNIARLLQRRGYKVAVAATLAEARTLCRDLAPAVVLTDYNLPDGTGLSLLDQVAENALPCKVVVITATGSPAVADEAIRRGAQRCLQKPVPFELISELVLQLHTAAAVEVCSPPPAKPPSAGSSATLPTVRLRALAARARRATEKSFFLDPADRDQCIYFAEFFEEQATALMGAEAAAPLAAAS